MIVFNIKDLRDKHNHITQEELHQATKIRVD